MVVACSWCLLRSLERHRDRDADRQNASQADEPKRITLALDLWGRYLVLLCHDYLLEIDATWLIDMRSSDSGL